MPLRITALPAEVRRQRPAEEHVITVARGKREHGRMGAHNESIYAKSKPMSDGEAVCKVAGDVRCLQGDVRCLQGLLLERSPINESEVLKYGCAHL